MTLLDEAENEMRYAETDQKGTDCVIPSVIGGDITVFDKDTDFYNVFPENTLKAGNSYDVTVQAYDRNSMAIEGAVYKFTLNA